MLLNIIFVVFEIPKGGVRGSCIFMVCVLKVR